jgi:hypothetical protein
MDKSDKSGRDKSGPYKSGNSAKVAILQKRLIYIVRAQVLYS